MAFFGVTIEEIATCRKHPDADKLDICTLKDMSFQFVTMIGKYKEGDKVLYFPLDSMFPFDLMVKMGFTKQKTENGEPVLDENGEPVIIGCFSGRNHNRLKSLRLRGEISQGIVYPVDLIDDMEEEKTPDNITNYLGVTKYEPEEISCKNGNLVCLPEELSIYDIEGADRFSSIAEEMMDKQVCITEKIEGMNFSVTYRPKTKEFFVNQRNYSIILKDGSEHMFWRFANDMKIKDFLSSQICKESITLYGEFIGPGIQGNIYKLKKYDVKFYDVKMDGIFLNVNEKMNILNKINNGNNIVPILGYNITLREWLCGKTIQEQSNGISRLNPTTKREGIVITPKIEDEDINIGRLILKQRSPEYLIKSAL